MLASAYELQRQQVKDDAWRIQVWRDSEAGLLRYFEERHGWASESEKAPYYIADLRQALQPFSTNGVNH